MKKALFLAVYFIPTSLLPLSFPSLFFPDKITRAIETRDSNTIMGLSEKQIKQIKKKVPGRKNYRTHITQQIKKDEEALERDKTGSFLSKAAPRIVHGLLAAGGSLSSFCSLVALTGFAGKLLEKKELHPTYAFGTVGMIALLSRTLPFTIHEVKKTYNYHGFLQENCNRSTGLMNALEYQQLIETTIGSQIEE